MFERLITNFTLALILLGGAVAFGFVSLTESLAEDILVAVAAATLFWYAYDDFKAWAGTLIGMQDKKG